MTAEGPTQAGNAPQGRSVKGDRSVAWAVYTAVHLGFATIVFWKLIAGGFFAWDYVKYYQCGIMARSAERFQVYDPLVQMQWYNRLIFPLQKTEIAYNQYFPICFVLMLPLSLVSFAPGFYVWMIGSALAGIAAICFLAFELKALSRQQFLMIVTGTLAAYPAFDWFRLGQSSFLLILFLSCYFVALVRDRSFLGGAMLALTTIKPQYTLFWAIPAVALRRYKLVAWCAAFEALLLIAATLLVGWKNVLLYPKILLDADTSARFYGVWPQYMISARGPLTLSLPASTVMPAMLVIDLLAVILLWYICRRYVRARHSMQWCFATTILIGLVCGAHVHLYDAVQIAICAACTWNCGERFQGVSRKIFNIWLGTLVAYPFLSWVFVLAFFGFNKTREGLQIYPWPFFILNSILLGLAVFLLRAESKSSSLA